MEKKSEEKEEDKKRKGTYLRREFSYTQFQQSLLLPDNIEREKISARVENGVMTIDIPKKKVEELAAATRQIEVKLGACEPERGRGVPYKVLLFSWHVSA